MFLSILPPNVAAGVGQPLHIPDGYFGPLFAIACWIIAVPLLGLAGRRLSRALDQRMIPLVAIFAAFSFVIMMFNVPLVGGTTGHAIGATIAAIVVGPDAAVIAVAIALLIQALFFGDGGLLAYGANTLLMAIIMPYTAYFVYRTLASSAPITSGRRLVAGFVAGWTGLSLIAGLAGVMFGLQSILFRAADGTPLYAPFPLSVAVPAMLIPHMLLASVIEGAVTAGILWYLQRSNPALLQRDQKGIEAQAVSGSKLRPLWLALAALIILSPLGLLATGSAWGEWAVEEVADLVGFEPAGMAATQSLPAPLPEYSIPGLDPTMGYIISAALGILLTVVVIWVIGRALATRRLEIRE